MKAFMFSSFALVYLLVSGSFAVGELLYAAAVAAAATALSVAAMRIAGIDQRFRPGWATRLLAPAGAVVLEIWPLTRALLHAIRRRERVMTEFSSRAFDPGASERAEDCGRRALVTLAISISPASLMLDRDVDCDDLGIARIGVAEPPVTDRRWPN